VEGKKRYRKSFQERRERGVKEVKMEEKEETEENLGGVAK